MYDLLGLREEEPTNIPAKVIYRRLDEHRLDYEFMMVLPFLLVLPYQVRW